MSNEPMSNVEHIFGRMTPAQFDEERARLQGLYGGSRKEAGAKYEQALAKLFYQSGWSQQELAKRVGKSKGYVSNLLTFGRFLGFYGKLAAANFPSNAGLGLTEFRFRGFWNQTDAAETNGRIRFLAVLELMQKDAPTPKVRRAKDIGKCLAAKFADGKWRDIDVIAKQADVPVSDVKGILQNIIDHRSFSSTCEKKAVAKTFHYRIFPQERQISTVELTEKMQPLLDILKMEGRKNMATMSPPTVAYHTSLIQALLNDWCGRPPKKNCRG